MARRGKAASRRDRQRRAQRSAAPRPAAPAPPLPGVISEAVEAAAEQRSVPRPAAPAPAPAPRQGRADPRFTLGGPSRLSERAAAEYHYVTRDLRNIGVLVAVMALLLAVAVIGFNALGIGVH